MKVHRADTSSVGQYSGLPKFSDLENWLINMVVMLQAIQYRGDNRDQEHMLCVPKFLSGKAKKWYFHHIDDLTLAEALFEWTADATLVTWGNKGFIKQVQSGYREDKLFTLILDILTKYLDFTVKNDLIWQTNQHFNEVVCIPHNQDMMTQILEQVHATLGHFRDQ